MIDLSVKYGENTSSSEFSSALLQKTHLPLGLTVIRNQRTYQLLADGIRGAYEQIPSDF